MHQTLPRPTRAPAPPAARLIVWTIAAVVAALTGAAGLLWARYGTAVFYEMILSGIAACF